MCNSSIKNEKSLCEALDKQFKDEDTSMKTIHCR